MAYGRLHKVPLRTADLPICTAAEASAIGAGISGCLGSLLEHCCQFVMSLSELPLETAGVLRFFDGNGPKANMSSEPSCKGVQECVSRHEPDFAC